MKMKKEEICQNSVAELWRFDSRKRRRAERYAPGCALPEPCARKQAKKLFKEKKVYQAKSPAGS
jgi:hypothetical protein